MRRIVTLVFALGLLLGIAGNAIAECGATHTDTSPPSTEKPPPRT